MIVQGGAEIAGDRLGDFDGRKLDAAMAERVFGERRYRDATRLPAVEHRPDFAVPFHPLGETGPARAFPRAEHRPDQGKNSGRLNQQPRRAVGQVLPVQLFEFPFEIIVDQDDREVGGAIDDANPQFAQRRAKLLGALGVDRLNAHLALLQIFRRHLQRNAQRRPIAGGGVDGRLPFRHDVAAVDQPPDGLVDHVGRKFLCQLADDLAKAFSRSDSIGDDAKQLAMQKEFAVFGIEAHRIGRQHIDGVIRRELRNVFAVEPRRAVSLIACHHAGVHATMLIAASVGRHSEADALELWNRRGLACTPVLVDVVGRCRGLGHNEAAYPKQNGPGQA